MTPVYFIATKLTAFYDRGNNDYLASSDLEDIIAVLNGREDLIDEIKNSEHDVKNYIVESFTSLLSNSSFIGSIPGHLNADPGREIIVIERIKSIVNLDK